MATSEVVVNSHNIFIDTDRGVPGGLKGDNYEIDLNSEGIHVDEGQYLRLTLNEFSMYKTWTNVNDNNMTSRLIFSDGTRTNSNLKVELDTKNYEFIHDIATNYSTKVKALLDTVLSKTGTISALTPDNTTGINGNTDNVISFIYTVAGQSATLGVTKLIAQFPEVEGDAYALLGANRLTDETDVDTGGITVTIAESGSAPNITFTATFQFFYPAQRNTTSNIYLRTSLNTKASETASLSKEDTGTDKSQCLHSSILGKIPVNSEFCVFTSNTGREYFIDVPQKHLTHFRLYITDEHNRQIARRPDAVNANTVNFKSLKLLPGDARNNQSVLGNLNFSCVLRADIIQQRKPNEHFTEPFKNPSQARQNGILVNPSAPPY